MSAAYAEKMALILCRIAEIIGTQDQRWRDFHSILTVYPWQNSERSILWNLLFYNFVALDEAYLYWKNDSGSV